MEIVRSFKKVERSYHSTEDGWRLATFEEALNGLESIKENEVLNRWDRARLLDGWISGGGYEYEMRQEFRGCMGYMLLIETQTSAQNASGTPYADVNLSELGKEVALFLCVDDWNYEVVYWLLNSWSKSQTMNLADVTGGNLPFVNAAEFKQMNKEIGILARRLGKEEVAAREKARTTQYSGTDSVREVLRGMIQIAAEGFNFGEMRLFRRYGGDGYFLPESLQTGDVAELFWSFVCYTFGGHVVEILAYRRLKNISLIKTKRKREGNLMIATSILLYLSDYRSDIIHEPIPHGCSGNCGGKILKHADERADGDPHSFSEMLKDNAMWKCYDETGNYGVLNKLLFIVAKGKHAYIGGVNTAVTVVEMLLECGAQPAGCYAIGESRKSTVLHNAAEFPAEDGSTEVAKALIGKDSRSDFVNATDENGKTALHIASWRRNASLCQLLVESKASVNAQDQEGMTPLHYALEGGKTDGVISLFIDFPEVTDSVDLKDNKGNTPLDLAIAKEDYESTAKLLSKSKEPKAYFSKVDQEQLLLYSLLVGSADIFKMLYENGIKLPVGYCDKDGKSALHLAAMLEDEYSAIEIIKIMLSNVKTGGQDKYMVAKCDRKGRTVLHEAASLGHDSLCEHLLDIKPELIYMKDRDGRNPLYDAVKGEYKDATLYMRLLSACVEDLIDRSGLTPLHVAVSQGNVEIVNVLLSNTKFKKKYLSRGDFLAQTALHKAAERGDIVMVNILLGYGAHPLRERDCDGRTALHYAVQAEIGDKQELAEALFSHCKSPEERALLSWASAAGLGTADQNLTNNDSLHQFLLNKKSEKKGINLLKMAASVGDIEMTKELIIRGYQIGDILDISWREKLNQEEQNNVTRVSEQIDMIKEQGNDKPAVSDSLGRLDYVQGLAALFLNPYIKPPIAVGITGTWGMGKSSLMHQTEQVLLTAAARMALLESSKSPSSELELADIKSYKLSSKGKKKCKNIYKQIKPGESINRNLNMKKIQEELEKFLSKYDRKYRNVFKSLAAMDSSDMFEFETNAVRPKADLSAEENVPAVLAVQYNAWKYRNDTEALAGMAVEITKELEGVMSQAQWLSTCCRNTWKKKKYTLWIEIFFPSLLALVLVSSLTWIAWVMFDSDKFKEWVKAKYAWPPAAMVIVVWTLTKSVMGILKPVSTQLMQYVSFPDHSDKLGYQERVISDITFLKEEIGQKPYWVFILFVWVYTTFTALWSLISESWLWETSLLFHHRSLEKGKDAPSLNVTASSNLRIIVFVDDLDRCQESVILQVLSAINIVLAECEINVVMGMDKRLIQRAIMKKYGDGKVNSSLKSNQELADMYLQKIIQLPLDLPDPSDEQSKRFLKGQLGVLENGDKIRDSGNEESDAEGSSRSGGKREAEIQKAAAPERGDKESGQFVEGQLDDGEAEAEARINMPPASEISETALTNLPDPIEPTTISGDGETNVQTASEKNCLKLLKSPVRNIVWDGFHALKALWKAKTEKIEPTETGRQATSHTEEGKLSHKFTNVQQKMSSSILIREKLFVRYSQGEENAFLYFQELATDCRKLPREWKRLLNYHRLVWYIFSLSEEAKKLPGWQVQLITWIFVCWEWQDNMNLVIEKWKEISDPKTSQSNEPPSLLMIVEHLIEEHEKEIPKMTTTDNEEDGPRRTEKLGEAGASAAKINNKEETEELEKQNENGQGKIMKIIDVEAYVAQSTDDIENIEKATSQKLVKDMSNKLDALEKSLVELKKEMKKLKELFSDELKDEMKELKKQVSDELKKDIHEIKEQMVKKQEGKNEQNKENRKKKLQNLENWKRMKSTLERYDVPMDRIQAFQRFRFYCIAGYLSPFR